jgi:phosphoribosylamine--glycine ligase
MKVVLIGSGGREHAIAWKLAQSTHLTKLYIAPGNPGTSACGKNVPLKVDDHDGILRFCRENAIDLVVVGPEGPLAAGLGNSLTGAGIRCSGPSQEAAEIESSKAFAKQFMARHNIPTARFATFTQFDEAIKHLHRVGYPVVVKASGLAAGKGVLLPADSSEAETALRQVMITREFGNAGEAVVIEERMSGAEVSLLAFSDGKTVKPMIPSQDHKRIFDGDKGPNTGGMGAYAPVPVCPPDLVDELTRTVLQPAVDGLRAEGRPFVGVLYAGLMLTPAGPRVIEFNCRFGDPETQVVLPLLDSDLLEIFNACVDGRLAETEIRWKTGAAACVVLASRGYPEKAELGKVVNWVGELPANAVCFHAGTKADADGQVVTAGGRVFSVTAWSGDLDEAVKLAYRAVEQIHFEGMQYRRDIASKAMANG